MNPSITNESMFLSMGMALEMIRLGLDKYDLTIPSDDLRDNAYDLYNKRWSGILKACVPDMAEFITKNVSYQTLGTMMEGLDRVRRIEQIANDVARTEYI